MTTPAKNNAKSYAEACSVMHYRCGMAAYKVTLYSPKSYAPHWGIDCK